MAIEAEALILANYTAKIKDTGELVETTAEEAAKEFGIYDATRKYEPRLLCVGEGWILKGVDEALGSASVGDKLAVEVPPEKGFGIRDPSKVKMIPAKKFGDKAGELRVGEPVEYDDKVGTVRFIGSGRVQVDFNHRLAGRTLLYDLEVVKKLEDDQEKIMALVRRRLPIDPEKISLTIEEDRVKIEISPEFYLTEGLQIIKRALANDMKVVRRIAQAVFIEMYDIPGPRESVETKVEQATPKGEEGTAVESLEESTST